MRKKFKSSTTLPLSNICVLVGRARHQASALSAELRKQGAEVIEIPFIEIRKPQSFKPLDAALRNLASYDWLILTSVNGVEAMWQRMKKLKLEIANDREGHEFTLEPAPSTGSGQALSERSEPKGALKTAKLEAALAAEGPRIAAIGPATKKAIEQRGIKVDVVPKEYVAESVVRSLRRRVKGKRVLLVRAKVARDVIPRELRAAGAHVDVVEAYETVVPQSSRRRLQAALGDPRRRPHVVTFTSSSTVRNFVDLLGGRSSAKGSFEPARSSSTQRRMLMASIGPVTSATLREMGLRVDISATEFTIPGLVGAIVRKASATKNQELTRK
jgi:uroporphyrinogen-III synthase